jgi:hypothetical protein
MNESRLDLSKPIGECSTQELLEAKMRRFLLDADCILNWKNRKMKNGKIYISKVKN